MPTVAQLTCNCLIGTKIGVKPVELAKKRVREKGPRRPQSSDFELSGRAEKA